MQRGGGRFAFVGRQGAAVARSGPSASALALRNRDASMRASAAYATQVPSEQGKDRQWYDWTKTRSTKSKHDPYYEHVSTEARYGMSDVWTQGMDPPQPIFPIDVKGRAKTYLPEVLSRKHFYMKYAMLNRPQQLNALNLDTIRQLTPVLKKWQAHKETTNAIVLTSSTSENFCSGTDFIDLLQAVKKGNRDYPKTYFKELYQLVYYINSLDKPFLPVMNGITMGAGASLAYNSGSFKVTTEDTIFALPETSMGFFPDAGASYLLPRLPDHVGTFLALTGKRIRGWDVLWSGIATNLVPADRVHILYEQLDQLRDKFHSFEQIIQCVHFNEADKHEHPYLLKEKGYLDIIKRCFSKPTVPEIMKALSHEKHPWAQQVLARLQEQCPLSLAVTLRSLQEGATKDLGAALRRDYRIALRFMLSRDFAEGVTARIVEKRKPTWSHKSVNDVHPEEVQAFFESLQEDELVIKSLDEERDEANTVQQILEKQLRLKKLMRRPWVQEEVKRYLNEELQTLQQELTSKGKGSKSQATEPQKVLTSDPARKRETIAYLQELEDELVRRRDTEKHAVTRTTVDKLEWKRWEDGIRNVREIKEILTLDVNPENEEQLTTGLLQGVLVENLRDAIATDDLRKQVNLVASALDTAGKSANELKQALAKRRNENVSQIEAEYERQFTKAAEDDKAYQTFLDIFDQNDPDEVKRLMAEDLGLSPEARKELDELIPSASINPASARRRPDSKQRLEIEAKPLITLDDVARLILGGNPDATQVADKRGQIERGEVSVSDDVYVAAGQLMRERALADVEPDQRPIVEATFDAFKDNIVEVVKAKVAGKSRDQIVDLIFNDQGQQQISKLMDSFSKGESQNRRAFKTNAHNQRVIFDHMKDFAKKMDSHIADGKLPVWKVQDSISKELARQELLAAWPKEKREQLNEMLKNDRELNDLQRLEELAQEREVDTEVDEDEDLDEMEETDEVIEDQQELLSQAQQEAKYGKSKRKLTDKFMSEQAKDRFERAQSDMGLGPYGSQFEYEKYSDRVAHFKRIHQRQEEFMSQVPDPVAEPAKYRQWLWTVRMTELAVPHVAEVFESWIERQAKAGYDVRTVPQVLQDGTGPWSLPATPEEDLDAQQTALSQLWEEAKESVGEKMDYPDSMPPIVQGEFDYYDDGEEEEEEEPQEKPGASGDELIQAIKSVASSSSPSSSQ